MKLINPLPSNSSFIYHYTNIDTALNYILKDGTLKFNPISCMNDPRESNSWHFSTFLRPTLNLSPHQYDSISQQISDTSKSNTKLVCFSIDKDEAIGKWQPEALLDRGFAKPNMWHHYGNRHNGLCLMFDATKFSNAITKQLDSSRLFSGRVKYSNNGITTNLSNDPFVIDLSQTDKIEDYIAIVKNHVNEWFPDLFLRKLSDWKNENEHRFVYMDDNPNPIFLNFDNSLEAIVIGEGVSDLHTEDILRHCVKYKADVTNLSWRNGYPMIVHPGQPYITHKHLMAKNKRP